MSFHLFTKIYVGEKIFLARNVISYFLFRFLIKPETNNNLDFKYLWRSKVIFFPCHLILRMILSFIKRNLCSVDCGAVRREGREREEWIVWQEMPSDVMCEM